MKITVNDISITYPDLAFAFNPVRVLIENYSGSDPITIAANGFYIEKEKSLILNSVSFELSAIAKSLFDRMQFYKVEQNDTTLIQSLECTIVVAGQQLTSFNFPVIWGALQIGETYTQSKHITYFRGYPFTVPLYVEGSVVLQYSADDGSLNDFISLGTGKYNLDISTIQASKSIKIGVYDERFYKIFDYTFDSTFGPERVLLPRGTLIDINIRDCPNEGIYLRWINKYGEYMYYLFQTNTESTTTKDDSINFDYVYYTTDFTDNYHFGTGKSIGKDISKSIKLFAHLIDLNTYNILLSLAGSPVVDMFAGYDSNNIAKWLSVNIQEGSFSRSTDNLQDFECYLSLNEIQVQKL